MWHEGDLQCPPVLHMRSAKWMGGADQVITWLTGCMQFTYTSACWFSTTKKSDLIIRDPLSRGSTWGSGRETNLLDASTCQCSQHSFPVSQIFLPIYTHCFILTWKTYPKHDITSLCLLCTAVLERLKEVLEETETSILAFKDRQREVWDSLPSCVLHTIHHYLFTLPLPCYNLVDDIYMIDLYCMYAGM